MAYTLFPSLLSTAGVADTWGIILAACIGALSVLLMISAVSSRLHDIVSVLIVGVMIGFLASSVISILQYFSDEDTLKTYLIWSFGSVAGTTWRQLQLMLPVVLIGLSAALLMPKQMNALGLGENYARSVGTNIRLVRRLLIVITSIITGCITAFTGPIAFLGMAVPHFVRLLFRTADHHILVPATILSGSFLLLVCDLLTQAPGHQFVLPINAITSLLGAPVVILVVLGNSVSTMPQVRHSTSRSSSATCAQATRSVAVASSSPPTSASPFALARSSCSWAPTAVGSPRSCTPWQACSHPLQAKCSSAKSPSPASR